LRTLMEGESIFNDAVAIVAYIVAIEVAFSTDTVTVADAVTDFASEVVIGAGVGAAVGFAAHRLMGTLDDHLIEITLSLVTAYGAYLLSDALGGSGVIAVVAAGLLIGNYGTRVAMSASSRVAMIEFWEVLAFLANSALFLTIGLEFDIGTLRGRTLVAALVAIGGVLLGRAVIAFGLLAPFRRSPMTPVPLSWQTAVFWGGLRGSIPIALVLGLDRRTLDGVNVVAVVFAVVLFSLIVQGVTYKPLLDRLGLTAQTDELARYERLLGRTLALRSASSELKSMRAHGEIATPLFDELSQTVDASLADSEQHLAELTRNVKDVRRREADVAARRLASVQKRALAEASRAGRISDLVARELANNLDLGDLRLDPDDPDDPDGQEEADDE